MALIRTTMYSELQSIANGIGKYHEGNYIKEQDAADCVRDLIKSLRRENETCDIRRFLGVAQVLQEDLIPLVSGYGLDDDELFEVTIRCLMNLTQPARIVFKNEVPQDKKTRHCYMETEAHLQSYKQAFVNKSFLAVLSERLAGLLELNWEDRTEDQNVLIERILVLLRNILHVQSTDVDRLRTGDDASTHDQVIWHMHQTGLDKLILYMASSDEERRFCIHVMEIISLMFRDQTPEQLSSAGASRSRREKERDEQELSRVAEMERARKQAQLLKMTSRHSRFGGTFVMKGLKSISDNSDIIYHRPLVDVKTRTFDSGKRFRKKPNNRKPIDGDDHTRRSTLSIRLCLKEFCIEFIKNCYNPLMRAVKSALDRDSTQENDETYYLWSMHFFMQFQRLYHFDVEVVRETMSVQDFHYVHTLILNHQDMMSMEKSEALTWAKRLHLALRTYQELLETLQAMSGSPCSQVRASASVIQQNVLYMQEYRDVLVFLLKKFDNTRQSKLFAKDLVETTHLYVRALEKWCSSQGKVLVQKKTKKFIRRKKKSTADSASADEPRLSQDQLEEKWDDLAADLSPLLQDLEEVDEDVSPFDATSDVSIDEQRLECVRSIHEAMHVSRCGEAIALLRAAREVWPENAEFGEADISAEDEFMLLREVFFADIPRRRQRDEQVEMDEVDAHADEVMEEEMEGIEEEHTREQEFDFKQFLLAFSSPKIVQVYALLLTLYRTNDTHTNHCVVKMLHRITVQNGMVALLFQISLFRTFQKIFNDDCTRASQFSELKTFALFVFRQFFKCAEKNPKVYVEMMFWKNVRQCHEVMEGYGSYKAQAAAAGKILWSEEEEMELRQLYEEHKEGEGDVVDKILANLIDSTRTRRQVVRQLILMDLVTNSKQLKKGISGRLTWTEQADEQLKDLYELHRNDEDAAGEILVKMDKPRRQIVSRLVELGLVTDRKSLHKPRKRKSRGSREEEGSAPDGETSDENSNSDEASGPTHAFSGLTRGDPQTLLATLRESPDMDYSLTWIQRSFVRTAEDREDEDEEPEATPLIPLMEECETALQDELFQRFLYSVGVNPPTDEQEQFWRISLELDSEKLRQVARALEKDSEEEIPQLVFKYNIPRGAEKAERPRKKKAKVARRPRPAPRQKAVDNDMGLSKPPISKEFVSTDESSDSDSERLKIVETATAAAIGETPSNGPRDLTRDSSSEGESDKENSHSAISERAARSTHKTHDRLAATQSSGSCSAEKSYRCEDRLNRSTGEEARDDEMESQGLKEDQSELMFESFPATALSQLSPHSSDSDDDHMTIARAVRSKKRKAGVLSDSE